MQVELEDIAYRKNYVLKIDWDCERCGKRTKLFGTLKEKIKNDPFNNIKLNWEDIVHKYCKHCDLLERPKRECNQCGSVYDFDEVSCKKCDKIIEQVILLETDIYALQVKIRQHKRKKLSYSMEERKLEQLKTHMAGLGYRPCNLCRTYYGRGDYFTCRKCLE